MVEDGPCALIFPMKFNKKGQVRGAIAGVTGLVSLAIVMVIYAIVSSYGAEIVVDTRDDFVTNVANCGLNSTGGTGGTIGYSACPSEYNISQSSLEGIEVTAEKMPTVGRITVAAIIITIILAAFGSFVAMR